LKDILPAKYSASNKVYEYGGSCLDVLPDSRVIFSNKDDSVNIVDPDTQKVTRLVSDPVLRYSDFSASIDPKCKWVLANEEDHTINTPYKIKNYVAAINVETGEVKRAVTGADFYYTPILSPDGTKLAWLQWSFNEMPFDSSTLWMADFVDGKAKNITLVSGGNSEAPAEPRWGPDGTLFFAQELGPYRQLFRIPPGSEDEIEIKLLNLEKAEFGELSWGQGR
jgi:hypothetical protein